MNKLKIFSIAIIAATTSFSYAQDVEAAKKIIDAEQYEKAKSMLKGILQAKPSSGKAAFLLGTIYLKQNSEDSAKIYFDKGLAAADEARFNSIGLGQLDLNNGNNSPKLRWERQYFYCEINKGNWKDLDNLQSNQIAKNPIGPFLL